MKNKDKISLKGVKTVVFNLNELVEDYMISTISVNKTLSHEAVLKALENGLLLVGAGNNVVRFFPPFNVTNDEIDKAISILEKVFEKISF